MKVFGRIRFTALPEKCIWPLARAAGLVDGRAIAVPSGNAAVAGKLRFSNPDTRPRAWPENCDGLSRAAVNGGNVKVLSKEKFQVLAERNGWSLERARGYVDGETFRMRAKKPSQYTVVGIDEYSLGFRAGYYERRSGASTVTSPDASVEQRANLKV